MTDWKLKEEMKRVIDGLHVSTSMPIYKDVAQELKRLWEIERVAKLVTDGFPYYSTMNNDLQKKIDDRLTLTKQLIKLLEE